MVNPVNPVNPLEVSNPIKSGLIGKKRRQQQLVAATERRNFATPEEVLDSHGSIQTINKPYITTTADQNTESVSNSGQGNLI